MNLIKKLRVGALLAVLVFSVSGWASQATSKFDEFGDIKCEDEMARLDNVAVNLQSASDSKAVIIFYGGRRFRGRLPQRGQAGARAARLKTYLVQRRGIPTDRVVLIDGGYKEVWMAEIWLVAPGASMPTPQPTIPLEKIRFRKGKPNPRNYECQI